MPLLLITVEIRVISDRIHRSIAACRLLWSRLGSVVERRTRTGAMVDYALDRAVVYSTGAKDSTSTNVGVARPRSRISPTTLTFVRNSCARIAS